MDGRRDIGKSKPSRRWRREKGGPQEPLDHGLGRSRGGFGTKFHVVVDGKGIPLGSTITAAQVHDSVVFEDALIASSVHSTNGRRRRWPRRIIADKAYSNFRIRDWCAYHHIKDVIPTKSNERRRVGFCKRTYRRRNVIERRIGWLKEHRRLATRYEKLAVNFQAMFNLAIVEAYLQKIRLSDRA
jgi:transposase